MGVVYSQWFHKAIQEAGQSKFPIDQYFTPHGSTWEPVGKTSFIKIVWSWSLEVWMGKDKYWHGLIDAIHTPESLLKFEAPSPCSTADEMMKALEDKLITDLTSAVRD